MERSFRIVALWMLIVLLTDCSASTLAAEADRTDSPAGSPVSSTVLVEPVVVTATRTPEAISQIPASPTLLTAEQIQRTPYRSGTQVDDLLRSVPGVQPSNLSSRYNHPTAQALTLRGLGSRRALVLLDGVPLNDGFGGWINWGLVPDQIDRIEIVPGGGSNLYGTWAMGGVVHVLSERPRPGTALRSESRAGNLNTYQQSIGGQYGGDRVGLRLGYRWYHTNGFVTVPEDQRGPVDRTNDSRHQQVNGTLSLALDPRTTLTLAGTLFREDRNFGTPLSLASRTIGSGALGLEGETRRGDRWEVKLFAQAQTFRNLTTQVTPAPTVRQGEVRDRIQVIPSNDFGGQAQWALQVTPSHTLLLGTDARAILAQSEEQLFTAPSGRSLAKGKQVGWGTFAQWIARPTERLTLVTGFRSDWWKNFNGRIESVTGAVTEPRDNVETALNPKIGVHYRLTDQVRIGASFYQAFRAPTLNELYRGFGFAGFSFLPNESLAPERLTGGEAKLEVDLLPEGRLALRVTGHYDEVKDQILFISEGPLSARRRNVGRTRTLGSEVEMTFRPLNWITVTAGYAYADSAIKSFLGDKTREGKRVPNVSRHQAVLGLTVGHREWVEVTILGRYLSRQFADDVNSQPIADFIVVDLSVQKQLGRAARLFLDAENLTDRRYLATQTGPVKTLGAPLLIMGGLRLDY